MASIEIIDNNNILLYVNEGIPSDKSFTTDGTQTLTNKTISYEDNTLIGIQSELVSGTNIKSINGDSILGEGDIVVLATDVKDNAISNIKTISFTSQPTISTTAGAITIDWTLAQNYKQATPTGAITYTFTPPIGVCHLQLLIPMGTAQVFTFPANVKWQIFTWAGASNKTAIINFWYDGTNYWAMGSNEV